MQEPGTVRRRVLSGAAVGLALAGEAAVHGGGDGGGGGGGGGGGAPEESLGGIRLGPPDRYGPPAFDPPEPGGGIAGGTAGLPPLTPRERAAREARKAGLEGSLWETLETIASGLDRLGSRARYGSNFVSGLSDTDTALTGGRAFVEACAEAIDRGAPRAEATEKGLRGGAIGAGLDHLARNAFGKATDGTSKNAKDATSTMNQIGAPTPEGVARLVPNGVGYVVTEAGVEKGKELAHPVLVSTADRIGEAPGKGVPNQSPPSGGG
ncbi:MAG: hypothetical protein RMK73_03515 [Geminicoccaceae bacterium]|nr:hypothetical protein [Geminicoccaceae bacterium]